MISSSILQCTLLYVTFPVGADADVCDCANAKCLRQFRIMKKYTSKCETPLLEVLRQLGSDARRTEFAAAAGTSVNYLYQLAGCNRRTCGAHLAKRIADASCEMALRYGSDELTMEQIATMCPARA